MMMPLFLSGYINLSPVPVNRNETKDHKTEVCTTKGLHFIHLNISSTLPKIEELQCVAEAQYNGNWYIRS